MNPPAQAAPLPRAAASPTAHPGRPDPRAGRRRRWLAAFAGAAAAVLLCELALRQVATGLADPWLPVAEDAPREPVHERRVYAEGIATSHFSPAHARLTGGAWMEGAPVGVITGDSHVEAVQVPDEQTMGAVVEREMRARGAALNVRQYGRPGYSAPHVAVEAPAVLRRWNPRWVVVVLADHDLDRAPLQGTPRLEIRPDTVVLVPAAEPARPRGWRGVARRAYDRVGRTALGYMLLSRHRQRMVLARGPLPRSTPATPRDPDYAVRRRVPRASVRVRRQAYGDRLRILYLPEVGLHAARERPAFEAQLLAACRAEGVRCGSAYPAFEAARRAHRMTRGFANTPLGYGHLNPLGHRLMAAEIVRLVEE